MWSPQISKKESLILKCKSALRKITSTESAELDAQEAYLTGGYCVTWLAWMGMSLAGIALANFIPADWGLGFAGVLSLVAIVCSMATTRLRILAALIAAATAVAAYALPLKLNIVAAIGVAVLACFWLEKQFGLDADEEDAK